MWRVRFLWGLGLILVLSACGYRVRGRPPGFEPSWHTIYVEVFRNRTSETRAGAWLAQALRERWARSGILELASSPQEADLILSGEILSLSIGGISYNVYTQTLERRISVRLRVRLRTRTGRLVWENRNLSRYENYPVEGTASGVLDPGRESALQKLSGDLAEIIYHQITSSF
ncbi:MAG TPA: hypothetical protein ENJ40_02975 [Thermosulfurimonas dismutans]|uniref:Lipoprotein n=1 Tax=Thermosulfurimonas dismutans TaxID=999894 RepID=A0A7C3CP64_9BACT|nr:hypothetical protein [Thermosulfurimonas dismutans]